MGLVAGLPSLSLIIDGWMDFLAARKKKSVPHYFDIMHVISSRHRPEAPEALPGVLPPPPPVLLPPSPPQVPPPQLVPPLLESERCLKKAKKKKATSSAAGGGGSNVRCAPRGKQ